MEYPTDALLARGHEINMIGLLTAVFQGKRWILLSALAGGACGLGGALLLPVTYTANTKILPPQQRSASAGAMLSQMSLGAEGGGLASLGSAIQAKSAAEMYSVMLGTRPVADAVILGQNLLATYRARSLGQARQILAAHTSLEPSKEGLITIVVTDPDPGRAAQIANGYVEALRGLMHGLALSEASQRRAFYEGQMVKVKEDLSHAELAYKEIQQTSRVISLDAQTRAMLSGVAEIRAQLTAKEVELERLKAYSTDHNPQVQIMEKELAALREQLTRRGSDDKPGYGGGNLSEFPQAGLDLLRAGRELKYQEALYELLSRQYEASHLDEAREAPVIQVLEPAVTPEAPSGPKVKLIALVALVVGVLAGAFRVAYKNWRAGLAADQSFRIRELRRALLTW